MIFFEQSMCKVGCSFNRPTMKYLPFFLLLFSSPILAQLQPEGWTPCVVQRDSLLQRIDDQFEEVKQLNRLRHRRLADHLSFFLTYRRELVENGECKKVYRNGYIYEKWVTEDFELDGYVVFFLGVMEGVR